MTKNSFRLANAVRGFLVSLALLSPLPAASAELIPVLMMNGEYLMPCDGQMKQLGGVYLNNKIVVGSYLFGNLITAPGYGADVAIWSDVYWNKQAPQSNFGSLGDLHIFSQPTGLNTSGRQGDRERMFPAGDGVPVNGWVYVMAVCWGGGSIEIYAQIWVRQGP